MRSAVPLAAKVPGASAADAEAGRRARAARAKTETNEGMVFIVSAGVEEEEEEEEERVGVVSVLTQVVVKKGDNRGVPRRLSIVESSNAMQSHHHTSFSRKEETDIWETVNDLRSHSTLTSPERCRRMLSNCWQSLHTQASKRRKGSDCKFSPVLSTIVHRPWGSHGDDRPSRHV